MNDKPLPEEIIDARDIYDDDESFYSFDIECPLSEDGEHDMQLVAIIDGYEIYECACGLIDC